MEDKLLALDNKLKKQINRFPRSFDLSIFKEKSRLLAFFDQEFVRKRSLEHLFKLLSAMHIKKKSLLRIIPHSQKNRCLEVRLIQSKLQYPFVSKWVIGTLVQISLNNRYELFDQDQLLKAVQKIIPQLRLVKGSVYIFQAPDDPVKTIYCEFEKTGNQFFTLSELAILKRRLQEEIAIRVERLVPSVFMTRNQEEILRNILTLSQEIEKVTDWPQVMISFETQTVEEFVFNAICIKAESYNTPSIDNLIKQKMPFCTWVLERKQLVKYLDEHQPIFAYIFRILLFPHPSILRSDGSLNFFAARQKIVNALNGCIGEFRDFNGGILIKQEETLLTLRQAFPDIDQELIENIFYSIAPIEMQAILPLNVLKDLVQLSLSIAEAPFVESTQYLLQSQKKAHLYFVIVRVANGALYEIAKDHLMSFDFPDAIQASLAIPIKDSHIFAYLLETDDVELHDRFLSSLEKLLLFWSQEVKKQQILRLSLEYPVKSLDPRIGGDGISAMFLKMLFEGLMHMGPDGVLENGLAERIERSDDKKSYLFHLRPSVWSDGTPLTSYDFEYAWKKILSPRFNTAFAFFFDAIKNAKLAKLGIVPMNQVGIQALDDHTLKVELEYVSPNFLEYLAMPFFAPICRQVDINEPNWPYEEGERYICNGAFTLVKNHQNNYVLVKNPRYWDKDKIHLDKVFVTYSHHSQSYELFSQNKIHWLGEPTGSWDNSFKPSPTDEIITHKGHEIYQCTCNTKHPLLKNRKIRTALSQAIDRDFLVHSIQYFNKPAYSPLPLPHSKIVQAPPPVDLEKVKQLFLEGLEETGFSINKMPLLTISYTGATSYGKAVAESLKQQWSDKLGLTTAPEGCDYKILFSKLTSADFHFTLNRWQPWANDPFYTLNCLADPEDPLNFCKWSHPIFQQLLKQAHQEIDDVKRDALLLKIEEILVEEMPMIPLFHTYHKSIKKKALILTPNHSLLDFKWARFVE
jgi:oligopeptide transport system substrate-binding protein